MDPSPSASDQEWKSLDTVQITFSPFKSQGGRGNIRRKSVTKDESNVNKEADKENAGDSQQPEVATSTTSTTTTTTSSTSTTTAMATMMPPLQTPTKHSSSSSSSSAMTASTPNTNRRDQLQQWLEIRKHKKNQESASKGAPFQSRVGASGSGSTPSRKSLGPFPIVPSPIHFRCKHGHGAPCDAPANGRGGAPLCTVHGAGTGAATPSSSYRRTSTHQHRHSSAATPTSAAARRPANSVLHTPVRVPRAVVLDDTADEDSNNYNNNDTDTGNKSNNSTSTSTSTGCIEPELVAPEVLPSITPFASASAGETISPTDTLTKLLAASSTWKIPDAVAEHVRALCDRLLQHIVFKSLLAALKCKSYERGIRILSPMSGINGNSTESALAKTARQSALYWVYRALFEEKHGRIDRAVLCVEEAINARATPFKMIRLAFASFAQRVRDDPDRLAATVAATLFADRFPTNPIAATTIATSSENDSFVDAQQAIDKLLADSDDEDGGDGDVYRECAEGPQMSVQTRRLTLICDLFSNLAASSSTAPSATSQVDSSAVQNDGHALGKAVRVSVDAVGGEGDLNHNEDDDNTLLKKNTASRAAIAPSTPTTIIRFAKTRPTPQKAAELGSSQVVTPVRRSVRQLERHICDEDEADDAKELLPTANWAYNPNKSLDALRERGDDVFSAPTTSFSTCTSATSSSAKFATPASKRAATTTNPRPLVRRDLASEFTGSADATSATSQPTTTVAVAPTKKQPSLWQTFKRVAFSNAYGSYKTAATPSRTNPSRKHGVDVVDDNDDDSDEKSYSGGNGEETPVRRSRRLLARTPTVVSRQ